AGLVSAIAWPVALLSASSVIDNPWNVCVSRATEVGEHLADILLARHHGKRPITLIGFSLGARVIYHCLLSIFLYRTMNAQFTIAGTGPVQSKTEKKIVNFNLSHIVKGHMDYSRKLTEILEAVGIKVTPRSKASNDDLQKLEEDEISKDEKESTPK
uniref:Transmembrane and coiled-coil domain-containing protein 4 n=1 Tax=Panagrolaimus sp. ES5 TaxID=591445 RepID=A0AC34G7S0_9BILA